jgi:DNA replication protein DnaC
MSKDDGHVSNVVGAGRFAMPGPEYFENAQRLLEQDQREADEAARKARGKMLAEAGVPEPHIGALLSGNADRSAAMAEVAAFQKSGRNILLLCGDRGVGKSFAAASVLDPGGGLYLRAPKLARLSDYDKDAFAAIESARVLVVDDLGQEFADKKEFFISRFDDLISCRYDSGRTTVLTANMSKEVFKERYGERVADRIREVGMVSTIRGESRRRKR